MNRKIVLNILDFLLGVSWAVVLLGAFLLFSTFWAFGILTAVLASFFGMILGFILVALFESLKAILENSDEIKQQTALLEEIIKKLDK